MSRKSGSCDADREMRAASMTSPSREPKNTPPDAPAGLLWRMTPGGALLPMRQCSALCRPPRASRRGMGAVRRDRRWGQDACFGQGQLLIWNSSHAFARCQPRVCPLGVRGPSIRAYDGSQIGCDRRRSIRPSLQDIIAGINVSIESFREHSGRGVRSGDLNGDVDGVRVPDSDEEARHALSCRAVERGDNTLGPLDLQEPFATLG